MNRYQITSERQQYLRFLEPNAPRNINCVQRTGEGTWHSLAKDTIADLIRGGVPVNMFQEFFDYNFRKDISLNDFLNVKRNFVEVHGEKYRHDYERPSFISEARFVGGRLVADFYIISGTDMGTVVEVADSENHLSLERKKGLYMMLCMKSAVKIKFDYIRIKIK